MFALYIIIFACIFIFYKYNRKNENSLPGPFKFPLIGNAYIVMTGGAEEGPQIKLRSLNKNYGKIAELQFGSLTTAVTEDYEIIKEIACGDAWVERPNFLTFQKMKFNKEYGLIFANGEHYKELRRFSLRTMRDFGFGRNCSMESFIQEEFKNLAIIINESIHSGDNEILINRFFALSILNILWGMIAGIRFSQDNQNMKEMINIIYSFSKSLPVGRNPEDAFPFLSPLLRHIDPRIKRIEKCIKDLQGYLRECLLTRRSEGHYKKEQRDFIDVFLKLIDDSRNKPESNLYNDESFIATTLDLFTAGTETSANTMEFSILYTILNPWVQKEVQKEIDQVVGRNRDCTLEDRPNMPFTEATILEIQRMANVLPTNGRASSCDTTIGKYHIKKGTFALMNLYGLHMDEKTWDEPTKFNPNRFLDKDRKIINANKILPFGAGKRACMGEVLAKSTLFIYYSNLLQKYTFSIPPNHPEPSTIPELGFTLNPKAFHFHVEHRI